MKKWQVLESKMAFDNRWFKVRQDKVRLANGKVMEDYFVWVSHDVAMVVPVTAEGKLVLVKQYKHGVGEIMWEYPAGYLDEGEEATETAKRELAEETGYVAEEITLLKKVIHHPTKETGCLYIFLAKVGEKAKQTNLDISEDIEVSELPIKEVLTMIQDGRIWATASITATHLALEKMGKLQYVGIDE